MKKRELQVIDERTKAYEADVFMTGLDPGGSGGSGDGRAKGRGRSRGGDDDGKPKV